MLKRLLYTSFILKEKFVMPKMGHEPFLLCIILIALAQRRKWPSIANMYFKIPVASATK